MPHAGRRDLPGGHTTVASLLALFPFVVEAAAIVAVLGLAPFVVAAAAVAADPASSTHASVASRSRQLPAGTIADSVVLSWDAAASAHGVSVRWSTRTEPPHTGFRVLRQIAGQDEQPPAAVTLNVIPGTGTRPAGASYEFVDRAPELQGSVRYYLEEIDRWGRTRRHGPIEVVLPGRPRTGKATDPTPS